MLLRLLLLRTTTRSLCLLAAQQQFSSTRSGAAASLALKLQPGEVHTINNVKVYLKGDQFLRMERLQEPGNVQSEWDLENGVAPDYAGTMASMAAAALASPAAAAGPKRVLVLGLGGGTIPAHILCGAGGSPDWSLQVVGVELDKDVAQAAREFFFPAMFETCACRIGSPAAAKHMQDRLALVEADARQLVADDVGFEKFDVIIEDIAYEQHGLLSREFWARLRQDFASPGATLLVNTLYPTSAALDALEGDLRAAGWSDIRRRVDRGLQVGPNESRLVPHPSEWRVDDNMIFAAVNRRG